MILEFYIDGQLVREPKEYRSLELELNFNDSNTAQTSISQNTLTWVGENAATLNGILADGESGGNGVFFGVPLEIKVDSLTLFEGYIDLSDPETEFSCDQVRAKIKESKSLDWMDEVADGFSFDLLWEKGIITKNDFVRIPYVQSTVPDYHAAAMASLMIVFITLEVSRTVKDMANIISDAGGVLNLGGAVLKIIPLIAYMVVLLSSLVLVLNDVLSMLIRPVRIYYGMSVLNHFQKACEHLNLSFESSIFQSGVTSPNELESGLFADLYVLPKKTEIGSRRVLPQIGKQRGYYDGSFGDFIRAFEAVFNAKTTVIGGKMYFERRDANNSNTTYTIPDVRREFYRINADEITSNYLVQFQVDNIDLNTIETYAGTNAKNQLEPINIPTGTNVTPLFKGLTQPNIPFALGVRKISLSRVEQFIKTALAPIDVLIWSMLGGFIITYKAVVKDIKVLNKLIKAINTLASTNIKTIKPPIDYEFEQFTLGYIIESRLGMLQLSEDMVGVPKLLMLESRKGGEHVLKSTHRSILSAESLWNKYHYIESFAPSSQKPKANQKRVYNLPTIPFCLEDYYKIRGQNGNEYQLPAKVYSPEGSSSKVLSLKWNIWQNTASIEYAEDYLFTTNIKETLFVNEGQ